MRIKLLITLVVSMMLLCFNISAFGTQEITVTVDGENLYFDVAPMMENGRVLVPMRGIFERLDAEVDWDNDTRMITAVKGNTKINLKVDSQQAYINNELVNLDMPAKLVKGRTLVPIRFISEALGAGVTWNQDLQTVVIQTGSPSEGHMPLITADEVLGVQINNTEFRMGDKVTIKQDHIDSEKVYIFIMPSRDNFTIPSAPEPYPTPDSILIAEIPVENHRYSYTFTLTPEIGRLVDGSTGKIGPGKWELMVSSDFSSGRPLLILPPEVPEQKAVLYDRGKVYTWSENQELKTEVLANPVAAPLMIGESQWGGQYTDLSLEFIKDWLDIPVMEVEPGKYRFGDAELGLTVLQNQRNASINGTMLYIGDQPLRKLGQTVRLPWKDLAYFFGYRCQWLGPEKLVMLHNMDHIPEQIQQMLEREGEINYKPGETVTLALEGKPMDLGGKQAFADVFSGRVLVPLRETAKALGAELQGFQIDRSLELEKTMVEQNYGLIDVGPKVKSYIDVMLERKMWRVYLTPETEQNTMISIDELTLALGYTYQWDKENNRINLMKQKS